MQVDGYGHIHVTAAILNGATEQVAYSRSEDGGATFLPFQVLAEVDLINAAAERTIHERENSAISLAVDDDNVYVAWSEITEEGAIGYYVRSTDNGATFSSPIDFSNEISDPFYGSTMPCVAADDDYMAISWYMFDKETLETKYIAAFSTDAGETISGYQTLSEENTTFETLPSTQFYGDYNDSDMNECTAHFTWTDGRSGNPIVYHTAVDVCAVGGGEVSIQEHTPVTNDFAIAKIYPNPIQEELNLTLNTSQPRAVTIGLYDINGKLIQSIPTKHLLEGENKLTISVDSFTAGTYLLKGITNDGYVFSRKWLKQ